MGTSSYNNYNHLTLTLTGPIRQQPGRTALICFCLFSVGFISTSFIQSLHYFNFNIHNNENINANNTYRSKNYNTIGITSKVKTHSNAPSSKMQVKVKRIALLGERNSGTTWLYSELEKCFPMVNVTPALTRWKHWFQEDIDTEYTRFQNDTMTYRSTDPSTLVIAEFRNVYDWVESMRNRPHNMPMHMNQDWMTFLTTAWTMPRPERDLKLDVLQYLNSTSINGESNTEIHHRICQSDFEYNQVISCVKGTVPKKRSHDGHVRHQRRRLRSEYEPIYEMRNDGTGLAYGSIIEMRRDKIINHLSVVEWDWVSDLLSVQYEKLLVKGTGWLLEQIHELTGLEPACEAVPPQPERLSHYPKDPGFEEWIGENIDWDAERLIGYTRW